MASYLLRNSPVPTSEKKFTFSTWLKLSSVSTAADNGIAEWYKSTNERHQILIDSATRQLRCYSVEGGVLKIHIYSNMVFRDCNSWYHIVIQSDNTLASSSDRFKLWVNGVAQTFASYSWTFAQNVNINVFDGSGTRLNLGVRNETFANFLNGYLADTYYIDGSIIAPTEFGEEDANGVWIPKIDPTIASFGNAGVHLKYENSGTIGLDSSGNGNNFSTSGTITKSVDTPSNVYATGNPLIPNGDIYSNGNNTHTTSSNNYRSLYSTLGVSSGKWYAECKMTDISGGNGFGIANQESGVGLVKTSANKYLGQDTNDVALFQGGNLTHNGSTVATYGAISANDIIQIALDVDNGYIYFGKNGTWQNSGDPTSGATGTGGYAISNIGSNGTYFFGTSQAQPSVSQLNFGNGFFGTTAVSSAGSNGNNSIFEYDVPTGYYALNTKNLATYG